MSKVDVNYLGSHIAFEYSQAVPSSVLNVIGNWIKCYILSCKPSKNVPMHLGSIESAEALKSFKEYSKHPLMSEIKSDSKPYEKVTHEAKNKAVFLTGGKDSVHCLLRMIETYPLEEIRAIYVDRINKSECYYERKSIKKMCLKLNIPLFIINSTYSMKLNRTGHNIGMREQLILAASLPFLISESIGHVYFGLTHIVDRLPTDEDSVLEWQRKDFENLGVNIQINRHVDYPNITEQEIMKDMIERFPDVLNMVTSCYTQINWREQMHDRIKSNFSSLNIYSGCGYCLKCIRINLSKILWEFPFNDTSKRFFNFNLEIIEKKFKRDETIRILISEISKKERDLTLS